MMGMEEQIDSVSCTMETGPVIQARGLIQGFHVSGHSRLSKMPEVSHRTFSELRLSYSHSHSLSLRLFSTILRHATHIGKDMTC